MVVKHFYGANLRILYLGGRVPKMKMYLSLSNTHKPWAQACPLLLCPSQNKGAKGS